MGFLHCLYSPTHTRNSLCLNTNEINRESDCNTNCPSGDSRVCFLISLDAAKNSERKGKQRYANENKIRNQRLKITTNETVFSPNHSDRVE